MSRNHTSSPTHSQMPRYLAYGLPREDDDAGSRVITSQDFELHDVPLPSPESFLDFDGVVVFAGTFESYKDSPFGTEAYCPYLGDLDSREREVFTLFQTGKLVIILLSGLPEGSGANRVPNDVDLFRRLAAKFQLDWEPLQSAHPLLNTSAPEFRDYLRRFGTAYNRFQLPHDWKNFFTPLFNDSRNVFGGCVERKLFFVPCTFPKSHNSVLDTASRVISAVIKYQERVSQEMPEWVNTFVFGEESQLRERLSDLHRQTAQVESQLDLYRRFKGALCYRSDPLVRVVKDVLERFFQITLTIDEKCVEDATLLGEQSKIKAVFEIKGVKGSFTRQHVNQLDSHRERLEVPPTTPGVLIMNTHMSATSVKEKDEQPHPDIVKKAVGDNVLLIRTLDVLRCADAVERDILDKDAFEETLLSETGWLKVENDVSEIVKG